MLLYHLSAHPFSDTYSLIHRDPGFYAKFSACKTLFLSVLQPVTDFRTYSRQTPIGDYKALEKRLRLHGAIVVQPLTREQAEFYLQRGGEDLTTVRQALRDDPTFWDLLDTPLMLNIVTLAYAGQPSTAWRTKGKLEERRRYIFDKYVDQMFNRRIAVTYYTAQQTVKWLSWLARRMTDYSQTVFYIEGIQQGWLPNEMQQWHIRLCIRTIVGLFSGLLVGLIFGQTVGLFVGLGIGLLYNLKEGVIDAPAETLRWSWLKTPSKIVEGLVLGLISGMFMELLILLYEVPKVGSGFGLLLGLLGGIVGSLLFEGLEGEAIAERTFPNEGIRRATRNALYSGLGATLGVGLIFGVFITLFFNLFLGVSVGLFVGLISGLQFGLLRGGLTVLQHFLLRLLLVYNGSTPWRYVRFLDYAAERILLRKVGGGYMFIHRYLLEYFASLDVETQVELSAKVHLAT